MEETAKARMFSILITNQKSVIMLMSHICISMFINDESFAYHADVCIQRCIFIHINGKKFNTIENKAKILCSS